MPRQEWRNDDESTMRDERERPRGEREDCGRRDRAAMFGGNGDEEDRKRTDNPGSPFQDEASGARELGPRGGSDDNLDAIATDETERLIASNKVAGTPVFGRDGDRVGAIHNFMVDKVHGHVVYAVLRHSSGFLGLDERFYPLDWDRLTFDTRLGGYQIDISEDELKDGKGRAAVAYA